MGTDDQLSEKVALVARWALGSKYRIVTAESCTGGWIAKVFTDAAGSSRWFERGYVTYSNEAKARDLGVSVRTLEEHGAVSEPTVREMAAGALRVTGADVSIAVSGIAGPDGGSAEKPVGTVWFCVGRRVRGEAGVGAGRVDAGAAVGGGGRVGAGTGTAVGVGGGPGAGASTGGVPGARAGAAGTGPGVGAVARLSAIAGTGSGAGPEAAGGADIELLAEGQLFGGDREAIRRASVLRALELVLQLERRS